MHDNISLAVHPKEARAAALLERWFVAENEIINYYETVEEEAEYPDLFGKTILVRPDQFAHIDQVLEELAIFLGIARPLCFIQTDRDYVVDSEGLKNPRLEISSRLAKDFTDDELRHVLAKEMFHIAAGHLRYEVMTETLSGLLENVLKVPGLNLLAVGAPGLEAAKFKLRTLAFEWFKYACFSADSFALAYTNNIKASINATLLGVLGERELVDQLQLRNYVAQISAIESCAGPRATLARLDEVLPYGPYRILNMLRFAVSEDGQTLAAFCDRQRSHRVAAEVA